MFLQHPSNLSRNSPGLALASKLNSVPPPLRLRLIYVPWCPPAAGEGALLLLQLPERLRVQQPMTGPSKGAASSPAMKTVCATLWRT